MLAQYGHRGFWSAPEQVIYSVSTLENVQNDPVVGVETELSLTFFTAYQNRNLGDVLYIRNGQHLKSI
jgi:hypothetical protein